MNTKDFKVNKESVDKIFPKKDINSLGYESPIQVYMGQMRLEQEDNIYRAIQEYGVNVDKEELIKALQYDRNQYDEGYLNGYAKGYQAKASEVAREILKEIGEEITAALKSNYKVLPQLEFAYVLYNRVQCKVDALRGVEGFVAELKKKYAESSNEITEGERCL